ncbi:hypothetical protein [Nocardioides sp. SYSU D00038]|uniref:hypothetical protein n=1 Tax=Nocardioides sp. SYSU D00038 TaxID=2812554 RepID=UPI001966DA7C|nr:hypothetical protein [Nocardioides sp. SYSU D00038]
MEVLLWLVPPAVVTAVAAAWAGWAGRAARAEVDRDEALRRVGAALARDRTVRRTSAGEPQPRSTGVAAERTVPTPVPRPEPACEAPATPVVEQVEGEEAPRRRAS